MNVNHLYNFGTINEVQGGVVVIGADGRAEAIEEVRSQEAQAVENAVDEVQEDRSAAAQAQDEEAPLKKKGRPRSQGLESCFATTVDAAACIERLRPLVQGRRGREVALVVKASAALGWLDSTPNFAQLTAAFGDLGNRKGFTEQMQKGFFSDSEIDGMKKKLLE